MINLGIIQVRIINKLFRSLVRKCIKNIGDKNA